jgi:hypothetical protein
VSDLIIPTLLLLDGLTCVLAAVFAYAIGLDPQESWGPKRFALLFLGIISILISLVILFSKNRETTCLDQ